MARITVEDCLSQFNNRFELTLLAARRARQLAVGKDSPRVPEDNDKFTVIALREIAANVVTKEVVDEIDSRPEEVPITTIMHSEEDDFLD